MIGIFETKEVFDQIGDVIKKSRKMIDNKEFMLTGCYPVKYRGDIE